MSEHVFKVSNTNMHTSSQMVIDDVPVKVKTSLHQAFSQVVDAMNLCFKRALLYNTPNK